MECFEENQVLGLGKGDKVLGLGFVGCGGFLEEDVLSGFEGLTCPFVVEAVREGVVDTVDFWVSNEGVVGGVCVRDSVLVCKCLFAYVVFSRKMLREKKEKKELREYSDNFIKVLPLYSFMQKQVGVAFFFLPKYLGFGWIASGDRDDDDGAEVLGGADEGGGCNVGRSQYTDPKCILSRCVSYE